MARVGISRRRGLAGGVAIGQRNRVGTHRRSRGRYRDFCHPAAAAAEFDHLLDGQELPDLLDLSGIQVVFDPVRAVIVGHSERRTDHGETDALINATARAAFRAGLTAIICIGETEQERRDGATLEVVRRQLQGSLPQEARASNTVIAYEPVWAIGSGLTPTPADIAEVHGFIRGELGRLLGQVEAGALRILYGGSVKPANASELLFVPDVDGALVGGASLDPASFLRIVRFVT